MHALQVPGRTAVLTAISVKGLPMDRNRQGGLTTRTLKNIAITVMFFDHFVSVFAAGLPVWGHLLRLPGRLAAPIMCYLIAEGFAHTSNLPRYLGRLFVFALLSHFPYVWYYGLDPLHATSVIWSLFLGLLALAVLHGRLLGFGKLAFVLLCCLLAWPADWNYIAVLWIVWFGLTRGRFRLQMAGFAGIGVFLFVLPAIVREGWGQAFQLGILLAVPLLARYNGRLGRRSALSKWGFYLFYPAHLLALCALRLALGV